MIAVDRRPHPAVVVAFSGLAARNRLYEWTGSFKDVPASFVGVRDPNDDWYQTAFHAIGERLARTLDAMNPAKVVCVGGSAGGFAALLYGAALGADRIVAFCPQSACGEAKRRLGDARWPKFCEPAPSRDIAGAYPRAVVHYATDDPLDTMHAGRIDAETVAWSHGGHEVPQMLKAAGKLEGVFLEAVS